VFGGERRLHVWLIASARALLVSGQHATQQGHAQIHAMSAAGQNIVKASENVRTTGKTSESMITYVI